MLSHAAIRWAFVLVRCTLEYCAVVAVEVSGSCRRSNSSNFVAEPIAVVVVVFVVVVAAEVVVNI